MRNTIILTAVLFIAVLAASIYYFRNLDKDHNLAAKPLRHLPDNTMLIAAIRNNEISDNIFKDFEVFDALLGFEKAAQFTQFKKDILRNEELGRHVQDTEVYFSFHPEDKQTEIVVTIPTSLEITAPELTTIINKVSQKYKISKTDTLGQTFYDLRYGGKDSVLYALYYQHILFASSSKKMLFKITDKNTKHLPDEQIDFFLKSSSRNTPLSIYFPHQQYDTITNLYQRKNSGVFLDLFKKMQGQSTWNINFKQDALMLTGESEVDQYGENYVSLFKNQQKTAQYLYNYFPANTAVYIEYSISNTSKFQKDLKDLFKRRKEKIAQEIDTTGLGQQLSQALGDDFAFVETSNQNYIGFIKQGDTTVWKKLQTSLLDAVSDSTYRFKTSHILYRQFGDAFKEFPRPYLTIIDDLIVIANSNNTLKAYREDWLKRDLLIGTLGFKNFEKLQGNEANVTLFVHTKNASSKILNTLQPSFKENFQDKENFGYQDFYSWSVQLSGNDGKFLSQIYAVYKSKNALGVTPDWTVSFENKAITQPYVFEHSDTSKFILMQELDHTIHALHPSGQKLWSTVFSGRVVGDMQQLADRSVILATDRNRLYRFDTSGKPLPGFSISLPEEPTFTPTIADLNGKQTIFVPTKRKILAYTLDGQKQLDWEELELSGETTGPVIVLDNQVIVGVSAGKIYYLNNKGQKQKETKINEANEIRNPIAYYRDKNSLYHILAVDTASNLYKVTDRSSIYPFEKSSNSYSSDFKHLTGQNIPEMIILDKGHLQVFNIQDSARMVYEHHFTKNIIDRPQYFNSLTEKGHLLLGIASKPTNLIYLFEETGNIKAGFPVEGQPSFYYGPIQYNGDVYLLVMRRDHKLYAFRHQK